MKYAGLSKLSWIFNFYKSSGFKKPFIFQHKHILKMPIGDEVEISHTFLKHKFLISSWQRNLKKYWLFYQVGMNYRQLNDYHIWEPCVWSIFRQCVATEVSCGVQYWPSLLDRRGNWPLWLMVRSSKQYHLAKNGVLVILEDFVCLHF